MQAHWKYIKHFILVSFIVVLCLSTANAAGLQSSLSFQTTGRIEYPSFKIGIYTSSWNFHEYDAGTIAATFDMSQSWWIPPSDTGNQYDAKISQVHALNPNYKALVYRDIRNIYNYWAEEWNLANSSGWLLEDSNGNYVISTASNEIYRVDITNRDYQKWVANKIESWLQQYPFFDGVMADNGLKCSEAEWEADSSGRPINPRTGTYFTWDEIKTGYSQLLNEIVSAVGPSKLVVPNGIWNGNAFYNYPNTYTAIMSQVPELNGVESEGTFMTYASQWYTEDEWLKSINLVTWIQDNFLAGHPERCFSGQCTASNPPSGATSEQVIQYGFCSMLLSAKYSSPQNTITFAIDFSQYPNLLQLVQSLRNVDLIQPLGDYYKIPSTAVYARDFVRGKVLVNPSDVSYTITLNGSYATIEGTIVSGSLTVYAHTGVILFR
jgi:hypothetical protein